MRRWISTPVNSFLSSNTQDFIEVDKVNVPYRIIPIPDS